MHAVCRLSYWKMKKKSRPRAAREKFSIKFGRICSKIHAVFSYEHISNQSTHPGAVFRAPHVAMCTRVPSPPPSHPPQSLPPPFPPPPTLLPPVSPLPSPRAMPVYLFTHGPARGGRRFSLGSALGLARLSARLGSAQLAWSARLGTAQHGSARLSTAQHGWNSRGCTHAGNAVLVGSARRSPAQLKLSSAHLLSREVRAARLDRRTAPAYALLGSRRCSPRRRHLRAQHRPGAAQPRFSKIWAVGREGAAYSLGHERCGAGEGGLPH